MSENYSGDLLKSLRKEQKMSQTKLAELSGISQSALVKYEKGTRKISKEIDNALSKVLNIDTLLKNDEVDCLIDQLIHYRDINDLSNKNLAFEMEISEVSLSYFLNRK
ncbi:TPA: helix-turn-helix domain-containing protein, partial [Enterococcus faecium]